MMKKIKFADQKIFTYFPPVGENVENLTIDEAHDLMRSNQSGCIRLTQNIAKNRRDSRVLLWKAWTRLRSDL